MTYPRWFRTIVVALMAATLLAGCSLLRPPPSNAELSGVWVHEDENGHRSVMTISGDGDLVVDSVPVEVFAGYDSPFWEKYLADAWEGHVDWSRSVPVEGSIEVTERGNLWIQVSSPDYAEAMSYIFNWPGGDQITFPVGPVDGETFVFRRTG